MNRIWAGLICVLAASWASAQEGYGPSGSGRGPYDRYHLSPYVGLSLGQLRYSEDGLAAITPTTAMFFVGAPLTPYLSVEGRLGGGLGSAETNTYGLEVHSLFAGYLKGSVPLAPGFSIYGLGGVANVRIFYPALAATMLSTRPWACRPEHDAVAGHSREIGCGQRNAVVC